MKLQSLCNQIKIIIKNNLKISKKKWPIRVSGEAVVLSFSVIMYTLQLRGLYNLGNANLERDRRRESERERERDMRIVIYSIFGRNVLLFFKEQPTV